MESRSTSALVGGGRVSFLTPVLHTGGVQPQARAPVTGHFQSQSGTATISATRPRSAVPYQPAASSLHGADWGSSMAPMAPSPTHAAAVQSLRQPQQQQQQHHQRGGSAQFVSNSISAAAASISADAHFGNNHSSSVAADSGLLAHQHSHHAAGGAARAILGSQRSAAAASAHAASSTQATVPAVPSNSTATHSVFNFSNLQQQQQQQQPHAAQSTTAAHPNASLIAQIEDQFASYMQSVAAEQTKGGHSGSSGSVGAGSSGGGSVSALPTLLGQLQSNQLLNFFEFTQQRQVLSIWGPSFDCLYFHAPGQGQGQGQGPAQSGSIYRDRGDYLHTLGNLQRLQLRCVDFQLLALHLPLIRQRMGKLRCITLSHNNIHSLHQLDQLALLAPAAAGSAGCNWPASQLESVALAHNAVCELQLYRKYMLSLLCMNALHEPEPEQEPEPLSWAAGAAGPSSLGTPRGTQRSTGAVSRALLGAPPPSPTGLCTLVKLDEQAVSDREIHQSCASFGALHRAKYLLDPSALGPHQAASSKWMEMLYESSIATAGGAAALGTAANPLQGVVWAHAFPAASCIPMPLRPVTASAGARKHAKRLVDELIEGAMGAADAQRAFDDAWEEALHGEGGLVHEWVALHQTDPQAAAPAPSGTADTFVRSVTHSAGPSTAAPTLAQQQQRTALDKTRLMHAFNASSNPTGAAAMAAAAAQARRKKVDR